LCWYTSCCQLRQNIKDSNDKDPEAMSLPALLERRLVGEMAPRFALPSLDGKTVDLAAYRGHSNVVVWFSRGFTCPFCRVYTDGVRAGYKELRAADTEVIQVAPNLLESARRYFGRSILPFPFICDPDKRLYAVYGLGDRGRSKPRAQRW